MCALLDSLVCALVSGCEKMPSFIDFPRGSVHTYLFCRCVSSLIDSLKDRRYHQYLHVCIFTYVHLHLHVCIYDHTTPGA